MLERAQILETRELPPYYDREGNVIPDLPRRGEVDVIVGGMCNEMH
jgi:hypothetical protein